MNFWFLVNPVINVIHLAVLLQYDYHTGYSKCYTPPQFFGTRDLFYISYSRELYLFSKFLHFEEIVRVKMAVCFEMIVSET